MQITEIKKIGKGDRYYLIIDETNKFVVEAEVLARYKLKTFDEIDGEKLNKLLLENGEISCFDRALSYLEKNIKTEKGIRDYLKQKGFLDESIDNAVEKLKEYGYIDDSVYVENYIRTYKDKKGKKLLKFELSLKGVDRTLIEEKLEELVDNEDEIISCRTLCKKYIKNKTIDQKLKQRTYAHLMTKGFASDVISRILREELCEQE